ncbi:hypothetical protein QEG98_33660 [Myxococcus sp. MxC21-1]|nr:hypothetical protein [Myxococcus sp. MxC21-1]WNZ60837.1 hypothetical protein QEG98_33660 [Myxococcus sp. MxC21-1]
MTAAFVKLLVTDSARSVAFYEALGFTRVSAEPPSSTSGGRRPWTCTWSPRRHS